MFYDEAERIANQIRRTIPDTVVRVLKVEHNSMSQQWQVKVDELGPASGAKGRGIIVWIATLQQWMVLQRRWSKLAEEAQKQEEA